MTLSEDLLEVEVNLSVLHGSSVSGRVVFKDGTPAGGVTVRIVPNLGELMLGDVDAASGMRIQSVSDVTGAFTLEHVPAGEFSLSTGPFNSQDLLRAKEFPTVVVDGTGDVSGIELVVKDGGKSEIAGVVLDDLGRPIAAASVRISSVDDYSRTPSSTTETGQDGRFVAVGLLGGPFRVQASKSGHSSQKLASIDANTRDLEITLDRHGRVSGRVVTPEGAAPGSGGKVRAKKVEDDSVLTSLEKLANPGLKNDDPVAVNDDGTFSVEAPAGRVEVLAMVPGFAPARSTPISVLPGQDYQGVVVRVSRGAVLHGKVTVGGNVGVEGATIAVKPVTDDNAKDFLSELIPALFGTTRNNVVTDEKGFYEVGQLAPGTYKVTAGHPEYAPSDPVILSLEHDQVWKVPTLVLSVGATIAGKVTEAATAKPGMMIQLLGRGPMQQVVTDESGSFQFRGLKPGDYLLNIMDMAAMQKGRMIMKSRSVTLEREEPYELEVVFGLGKKVFGRIKGLPTGAAMQVLTLRRPGGPGPEDVDPVDTQAAIAAAKYQAGVGFISADGTYEVSDIEPGTYILEVPRMPADPTDMAAYQKMDRTPHYRKEITMETDDVEHDIVIKR